MCQTSTWLLQVKYVYMDSFISYSYKPFTMASTITVEVVIAAPIEKVWKYWTQPEHIAKWNTASDDWHCTNADNDLQVGGRFNFRMEAKDGSMGFNFSGTYTEVLTNRSLAYTIDDGRRTTILLIETPDGVRIVESFDAGPDNPIEIQRSGWQAILNNFKRYAES